MFRKFRAAGASLRKSSSIAPDRLHHNGNLGVARQGRCGYVGTKSEQASSTRFPLRATLTAQFIRIIKLWEHYSQPCPECSISRPLPAQGHLHGSCPRATRNCLSQASCWDLRRAHLPFFFSVHAISNVIVKVHPKSFPGRPTRPLGSVPTIFIPLSHSSDYFLKRLA